MQNFGFDTFISILLPGVFVSVASYLLLRQFCPETEFFYWLQSIAHRDVMVTLVMLISSSFFGAVLGSLQDFFEWRHLDARASKRLGVSREAYNDQWHQYIAKLPLTDNPYIRTKAQLLRFELRTALALAILAVSLLLSPGYLNAAIVVAILSMVVYYLATETHYLLAYWRDSEFGQEKEEACSSIGTS